MDLTTATPADVDMEIARIQKEIAQARYTLDGVIKKLGYFETGNTYRFYVTQTPEELEAARDALRGQIAALYDEEYILQQEYVRRGHWARYYRVDNSNGHVHTNTSCRTTYASTVFGWLPQVSGATAEEIVELAGAMTCLVCFPEVRQEILAGRPCRLETDNQRKSREEREAAAQAKAEKSAAKAAKAIANPDGSPLRLVSQGGVIKTERTAQSAYVDAAAGLRWYEEKIARLTARKEQGEPIDEQVFGRLDSSLLEHQNDVQVLTRALAHKRGTITEVIVAELAKKVEARYRRDWDWR